MVKTGRSLDYFKQRLIQPREKRIGLFGQLTKISFACARFGALRHELIRQLKGRKHRDACRGRVLGAAGDLPHEAVDMTSHTPDVFGIGARPQGVVGSEDIHGNDRLGGIG